MSWKKWFAALVVKTGILALYSYVKRWKTGSIICILMYHRIAYPNPDRYNDDVINSTPEQFEAQMKFLAHKYNVIGFEELHQRIEQRTLSATNVIITFDDGYKDNLEYAYPILKKYNLPAMIFLTTNFIDSQEIPWWDLIASQIKTNSLTRVHLPEIGQIDLTDKVQANRILQAKLRTMHPRDRNSVLSTLINNLGQVQKSSQLMVSWTDIKAMQDVMTYGGHTVSHPPLARISLEEVKKEVTQSKKEIEKQINQAVTVFSYPYGEPSDYNDEIIRVLREQGYHSAVTSTYGTNTPKSDTYTLKRICIERDDDINMFQIKLMGFGKVIIDIYQKLFRKELKQEGH